MRGRFQISCPVVLVAWTGAACGGDDSCSSPRAEVDETVFGLNPGGEHMCARTNPDDARMRCWGSNEHGQLGHPMGAAFGAALGDDEAPGEHPPVAIVPELVSYSLSSLALGHECVWRGDEVRCWGTLPWRPDAGAFTSCNAEKHAFDGFVVAVSSGEGHICALFQGPLEAGEDAVLRCWGRNAHGQLGYGHTMTIGDDESPEGADPVPMGEPVGSPITGGQHTCARVAPGALRCWGWNAYGQLGYGHTDDIGDDEAPIDAGNVSLSGEVGAATAGAAHTCAAVSADGTSWALQCWGRNDLGQLGSGHADDIGDDELPSSVGTVDLGTSGHFTLHAGGNHTCAVLAGGGVVCWGGNQFGQLGYGHTENIGDDEAAAAGGPVPIGGPVTALATGRDHTCALLNSGLVRCWGLNDRGQLGYGHTESVGDDETPDSVPGVKVFP